MCLLSLSWHLDTCQHH